MAFENVSGSEWPALEAMAQLAAKLFWRGELAGAVLRSSASIVGHRSNGCMGSANKVAGVRNPAPPRHSTGSRTSTAPNFCTNALVLTVAGIRIKEAPTQEWEPLPNARCPAG